jgi:hypothetical protein
MMFNDAKNELVVKVVKKSNGSHRSKMTVSIR